MSKRKRNYREMADAIAMVAEEAMATDKNSPEYQMAFDYAANYAKEHPFATVDDFFMDLELETGEIREINPFLFLVAMADANEKSIAQA